MQLFVHFFISLLIMSNSWANARFHFGFANNSDKRIVGGSNVPKNEFIPYQVSLQYYTSKREYMHFCGGSIISEKHILTAAHCCRGLNVQRMSVVAGIRDINSKDGERVQVVSFVIHPDYQELITSDIAILSIDPPLKFNNHSIAAINVMDETFIEGGMPVTLTGWGLRLPVPFPFIDAINYPSILQKLNYQTITNQQCRNSGMQDVTDTEICARGPFRGACSGDSGGPLVMSTPAGLKQVGIVSYGMVVCGLFVVPDVYTRVSTFKSWIQEQLAYK